MAILCIEVLFFRENSYGFPSFAETVRAVRTFPLRVLRKQKRPENPMFAGSDRVSVVDNEGEWWYGGRLRFRKFPRRTFGYVPFSGTDEDPFRKLWVDSFRIFRGKVTSLQKKLRRVSPVISYVVISVVWIQDRLHRNRVQPVFAEGGSDGLERISSLYTEMQVSPTFD